MSQHREKAIKQREKLNCGTRQLQEMRKSGSFVPGGFQSPGSSPSRNPAVLSPCVAGESLASIQ